METYKGIDLTKEKEIKNFIDTFFFIGKTNCIECLDNYEPLQKLVRYYYFKKKIKVLLFNIAPYLIITATIIWEIKR